MDSQNVKVIIDSLLKVANSAPTLNGPAPYFQQYYFNQQSMRSDVSKAEFDAWIQYVNQTLDISQKYTNWSIFTKEKIEINQASLNEGIPYIQRIQIIQQMLINLSQQIYNYN